MENPPDDPAAPEPPPRPAHHRIGSGRWWLQPARWAGELATVFVGVYAAFVLNSYQAHRLERQRRGQILAWAEGEYSETLANLTIEEADLRKGADKFHRRLAAGETPALHGFNYITDYNPADFTSMLQSGGFDLLEIETVRDIRDVESSLRQMIEMTRHDQQLSDALILPNLDKPPGFFYDRASPDGNATKLKPAYAWIDAYFETQLKIDDDMRASLGKALAQLRRERERNR